MKSYKEAKDELFDCLKWKQILLSIDDEVTGINESFGLKSPSLESNHFSAQSLDYRIAEAITKKDLLMIQRKNITDYLEHIDKKIMELPDGTSCRILHLRFISFNYKDKKPRDYTLEEIADIIGYSYRGFYKKYKKSIDLFIKVHMGKDI